MNEVSAGEKSLLREWIHWIMGGLIAWGLLLGLGAYLYSSDPSVTRNDQAETEAILRGVIIATCAVGFVTFWWVMLIVRERRINRRGD